MVMVKLKMRTIYKSFLSFIGFLIIVASILGISYLFYDKVLESDSDIEVTGALSINYIDGKTINVENKKTIKFSITNSSDETNYYNIGFLKVRGNGNYKLKYENSLITKGELRSTDEITTDYISIEAGETKEYSLEIINNDNTTLTAVLNIRDKEGKIITFSDAILKNVIPKENTLTKVGVETATENEGLIKSYDDMGISYYFRGNVSNNYVSFADLLWRIVKINGDGTVKLVLDDTTDSLTTYYNDESENYEYKNSPMEKHLNDWFELNLNDYTDYIANTKFCNDINHDESYNYNSYSRIMTNQIPTLNCLGEVVTHNIGILTIDEVILAGANTTNSNTDFYLHNTDIINVWYTMSGAKGSDTYLNMFMVTQNGEIETGISGNLYRSVRPVINLVKNIEMIGTGSIDDPYRMAE